MLTRRLYIRNLPFGMTPDELRDIFSWKGSVKSARIIMDRYTGRSRGFGFVEMETDADAQRALSELNNTDMGGRTVLIEYAKSLPEKLRSHEDFDDEDEYED